MILNVLRQAFIHGLSLLIAVCAIQMYFNFHPCHNIKLKTPQSIDYFNNFIDNQICPLVHFVNRQTKHHLLLLTSISESCYDRTHSLEERLGNKFVFATSSEQAKFADQNTKEYAQCYLYRHWMWSQLFEYWKEDELIVPEIKKELNYQFIANMAFVLENNADQEHDSLNFRLFYQSTIKNLQSKKAAELNDQLHIDLKNGWMNYEVADNGTIIETIMIKPDKFVHNDYDYVNKRTMPVWTPMPT